MEQVAEIAKRLEHSIGRVPTMPSGSQTTSSVAECPGCSGSGYVYAESPEVGLRLCGCQRERRLRKELPRRFWEARLGNFAADVVHAVETWLAHPTDGLLLTGNPGTGKTHLACAIVRARTEAMQRVAFRRCMEFYAKLREAYTLNSSEANVLEDYLENPLLVLDDLGAGGLTDHERRNTLEVLDRRGNALLPTVVTTNWTLQEIGVRMDDRIASRLAAFTLLELQGRDRRLRR